MTSADLARGLIGATFIVFFATGCTSSESSPSTPTPAPAPPAQLQPPASPTISSAEKDANLEQCRDKLKAAAKLDLLEDMSFDGGRPKVAIGPTWYQIDFSAKQGLAQTAACFFLAGDSTKAIRFDITDNMTGKPVATWSYTKLEVR
jgi:hypothetical protein